MNAPEGQSLQRDIKLQMKKHDAARLYLNLLKCYSKFNSFFSFPVFLLLKNSTSLGNHLKQLERRQEICKLQINMGMRFLM
jgi:hypothetical protein